MLSTLLLVACGSCYRVVTLMLLCRSDGANYCELQQPARSSSENRCGDCFLQTRFARRAAGDAIQQATQLWLKRGGGVSTSTDPSSSTLSTRRLPAPQDFETEGFRKLRASPAFVFIRSTEPYLDVYADFGATGVAEACADAGFGRVEAVAATGRHYALVAAKDGGRAAFVDRREATKLPDTHLKTWESKSKS